MIIPRQENELAISHAIRVMRFKGPPDLAAICHAEYGGFRSNSLIPWNAESAHLRSTKGWRDFSATDAPFLYKLGGRPWPKQLVPGRARKPESLWSYLLERSHIRYLRFCPICAANEFDRTGSSWWHVEHNLPGTLSCIHHGTILEEVFWEEGPVGAKLRFRDI